MTKTTEPYRKDILGDLDQHTDSVYPLIPAATVVLLRTQNGAVEVLMLQKNMGIAFGGMWVFPGGKIDAADYPDDNDMLSAASTAAVRETEEETGLRLNPDDFIWFSHWTPPPSTPKRFSTWFFVAETDFKDKITVDGGEILDHRWIKPEEALAHQAAGDIELAPPTWVTLHQLAKRQTIAEILQQFERADPLHFATRLERTEAGTPVAIWFGDSAFDSGDLNAPGQRHRLLLKRGGFVFENTVVDY